MRKTAIALSAFALAVTLGACGDNGGSSDNGGNGGGNSGGTVAAASLADLAKSIGDKTAETDTAHVKITANAVGQEISGDGDVKFAEQDVAMSMDMSTPQGTMSMVFVENVFYIKLPQELEPGKSWVKIDTNDENDPIAKALGGMTEQMSKNADPRAALAEFEKSGEITDSKEETLDGQKTTHYTITVDVEKMAANQTDPTMKSALEESIKNGMKDFPVDIWVNEDDLPVRVKMDMPAPDPTGSGTDATVKMQMDYTKWGEPVEINAPDASEVAKFPTS